MNARTVTQRILLAAALLLFMSCKKDDTQTLQPQPATRTYRMGFSGIPPRADINLAIASIDLWSRRADAAIISFEMRWGELLDGVPPETLVVREQLGLAASDVRARNATVKLSVSVQVDYAWGRFSGGVFQGVATDFNDFPLIQELGLSSYPYLAGYAEPEQIPLNYYSRLVESRTVPVMVTEGGWSSATLDTIVSSLDEQRRYIAHQMKLLDAVKAQAVFQLTFTDLDLVAHPPPPGSIVPLFARCGLVDVNLNPKPALSAWDSVFAISRR